MRRLALALAGCLLTVSAAAQQPGGPRVSQLEPPTVTLTSGKSAHVTLQFRVADYYHINSHKPLDELLLPTELKLSPPTEILVSNIIYPQGHMLSLPFSPESRLSVYTGDFDVDAMVRTTRTMPSGTFRVHGELKFQACNDRQCFPPKTTPVQFDVKVLKAKSSHR
jgi:Thiol:disulfide interchange protein DsbD, N-terminal